MLVSILQKLLKHSWGRGERGLEYIKCRRGLLYRRTTFLHFLLSSKYPGINGVSTCPARLVLHAH